MLNSRYLSAIALVIATPGLAHAEPVSAPTRFEQDGNAFTFTTATKGDTTVIRGDDGFKKFTLYVHADYVTGTYGGSNVNFRLRHSSTADNELAAR